MKCADDTVTFFAHSDVMRMKEFLEINTIGQYCRKIKIESQKGKSGIYVVCNIEKIKFR